VSGASEAAPGLRVGFGEAFRVWARIGCLSFGGPAGQIALMHREIVEQRKWLTEDEFLNALNFCMLLPGPEAMQLATYAGWRRHGVAGGLMAGLLFVIPGALVVLALSASYLLLGNLTLVQAAFVGIKAAVLVIVVEALLKIAKRALKQPAHWAIAAAAFVAIFVFMLPFPLIVVAAAAIGVLMAARNGPQPPQAAARPISHAATFRTVVLWLLIWLLPLAALWLALGGGHVLVEVGKFFSVLAVVTFGGAYAVLAYMAQAAVETYGWLSAGEMLDGLGLAETTPGPLILVTEFVGFLAAARAEGGVSVLSGLAGAAVTLWVTFAPCFLWVLAGAPYVERIGRSPRLKAGLTGITAAVVGVILNLSLWFALHVLAPGIADDRGGWVRGWILPDTGIDWAAVALAGVAVVLLFPLKQGIFRTLVACAGLALAGHWAGVVS
jgi:chromate transporter